MKAGFELVSPRPSLRVAAVPPANEPAPAPPFSDASPPPSQPSSAVVVPPPGANTTPGLPSPVPPPTSAHAPPPDNTTPVGPIVTGGASTGVPPAGGVPSGGIAAGPGAPGRPGANAAQDRTFVLDIPSEPGLIYDALTGLFTAYGTIRINFRDGAASGRSLSYDPRTNVAVLKGNVILNVRGQEYRADAVTLDTRTRLWNLTNFAVTVQPANIPGQQVVEPIFISGPSFSNGPGNEYHVKNGQVTSCDLPGDSAHYWVNAKEITLIPGRRLILRNASFVLLRHRLFTLPILSLSLDQKTENNRFLPEVGHNQYEGYFIKERYPLAIGGTASLLLLDLMSKKGIGKGIDDAYRFLKGTGRFHIYQIKEKDTGKNDLSASIEDTRKIGDWNTRLNSNYSKDDYSQAGSTGFYQTTQNTTFGLDRATKNSSTSADISYSTNNSTASKSLSVTENVRQTLNLSPRFRIDGSFGRNLNSFQNIISGATTGVTGTSAPAVGQDEYQLSFTETDPRVTAILASDIHQPFGGSQFYFVERYPELTFTTSTARLFPPRRPAALAPKPTVPGLGVTGSGNPVVGTPGAVGSTGAGAATLAPAGGAAAGGASPAPIGPSGGGGTPAPAPGAGGTADAGTTGTGTAGTNAAAPGTPATGTPVALTPAAGSPAGGAPTSGTTPSGTTPSGTAPSGTAPAGIPTAGIPTAGITSTNASSPGSIGAGMIAGTPGLHRRYLDVNPINFSLSLGHYREAPMNVRRNRMDFAVDAALPQPSIKSLTFTGSTRFEQKMASDNSAQYVLNLNSALVRPLSAHSFLNLAYYRIQPVGYTPFQFDRPGNVDTASIGTDLSIGQQPKALTRVTYQGALGGLSAIGTDFNSGYSTAGAFGASGGAYGASYGGAAPGSYGAYGTYGGGNTGGLGSPYGSSLAMPSQPLGGRAPFIPAVHLGLHTSYDFNAARNHTIGIQKWAPLNIDFVSFPTRHLTFYASSTYNLNGGSSAFGSVLGGGHSSFTPVRGGLRWLGGEYHFVDTSFTFDPATKQFTTVRGHVLSAFSRLWTAEAVVGYQKGFGGSSFDPFGGTFQQVLLTRDLHCFQANLFYATNPQQINFSISIKAFPILQRFGVQKFGQLFNQGYGRTY